MIPGPTGADVLITVDDVRKGIVPEQGVVIAALDNTQIEEDVGGADRDLNFASGQPPYLLYLRERADGRYDTSVCDGTRFLDDPVMTEEVT